MATPRADTYTAASGAAVYAGRPDPAAAPSWVPATAWQWTDVPGTRWDDYIRDDGAGLAPQITALDPGVTKSYSAVWEYSGPTYSVKNHEFWHFGGGHAGTTINILTKISLGNTPAVAVACQPSTESVRRTQALTNYTTYVANGPYFSDGKPYSPHSYYNNVYLDSTDEFVSFCVAGVATSSDGSTMGGVTADFYDLAAFQRSATTWRAADSLADVAALSGVSRGPRVVSADGSKVYYWAATGGLRVYNRTTNAHAVVGGTDTPPNDTSTPGVSCNDGTDVSLHITRDSGSGWQVKRCNLSTGVQTSVTVSGYALPTGYQCVGVVWSPEASKYIAVWVNSAAYNAPSGSVSSTLVTTLTMTGANTATAELKAMTGTGPTGCASYTGIGYDYGCVLLNIDRRDPVKAIKVA